MLKKYLLKIVIVLLIVAGTIYLLNFKLNRNEKSVTQLNTIEIQEYEGKDLSSVNDFRENSIKGPQHIDINNYELRVTGLVNNPINFLYDDITNNYEKYEKVVTLNCVEGWSATILWEGVLLRDVLAKANPKSEAKVVIFKAYDGYSTSFPIEYIFDNDIMMAYKMNGAPLLPERGFPFQLVAESKWGYKWIKWITEIELSDDINYKGYWESRGYSNKGDLDKKFYD